jgi:hypothetical protein
MEQAKQKSRRLEVNQLCYLIDLGDMLAYVGAAVVPALGEPAEEDTVTSTIAASKSMGSIHRNDQAPRGASRVFNTGLTAGSELYDIPPTRTTV